MKAMILKAPKPIEEKPLEHSHVPVPEPGPGQVLVRVSMCGLCHTDLHTIEGDLELPRLPLIPGHQIVGTVVKRGAGVESPGVGERVGAAWLYETCGECRFCARGLENLCENARFTGYHADGGYAEYAVLPADFVYELPGGFGDREAAPLLCAGIIGYRALRLSGIEPGGVLGLYGFGASAHVAIQVALYWGCEVLVFSRTEAHRRQAERLGASWTGTSTQTPPKRPNASVVFAPAGSIVPAALSVLEKGGTVALAGITMTEIPPLDYELHLYHEKTLRSVTASTREDGRELIRLAAEIPIRTETTLFRLEEANEALWLIKESRISGAGVLEISRDGSWENG
ncbi:MAG TPA: zinc-binding alcohol dehydrogenase family protein [Candidatus Eisenbacteria bacterium]|uniref:alcohol dehydrogenase n=1 Tax=Eiseniibacteriota bacterium TaxID=2212470 RepID=A0A7V2F3I2_UNCEI|nr:zinc-binding alcohol dehydrogenase family protein [Candidatus Eisenbacteria bacterium]